MKLVNFSVTNFRSITAAHRVPISDTTVLIGRNNEGKSNILKAVSIAMNSLYEHAYEERRGQAIRRAYYRRSEGSYSWERDFPINLRKGKSSKRSIFRLEFLLEEEEIQEFRDEIKSNLNGTLPLEIRIGEDNRTSINVSKRGRGSATLNSKSGRIADFIAKRIFFNYIPAVRTDKEAISVISDMVSRELKVLEGDENYRKALEVISDLQEPILKDLAKRIKEPLSEFLPNINGVSIEFSEKDRRFSHRRDFEVIVDDGTPTSIELKGDGVKSLATLGLLKNRFVKSAASIIAIEEPESHLHPAAIHQLNEIISSLSDENQVIVTTHNPLFVDRVDVKSNVIIEEGRAVPAKNVKQIRELLGIKASDNLTNANFALIVEGEEDKHALIALLSSMSNKISRSLKNNILVIEPIGGAGNLSYKLSLMKNQLCVCHVLLDNDDAGRNAYQKAYNDELISVKDTTMIMCRGMVNSEFEDCIDPTIYVQRVLDVFGVDLSSSRFRGNRKWSDRIKDTFMDQGKPCGDQVMKEVKYLVAKCVSDKPKMALSNHKRNSIDSLASALEKMIKT